VFFGVMFVDIIWVLYTRRVSQGKPLQSALFGTLIYFGSGYAIISYTNNPWMLLPAGCGAFIGTYVAVRWDAKKTNRDGDKDGIKT